MNSKDIISLFLCLLSLTWGRSQEDLLLKADEYIVSKQYAKAVKLLEINTENSSSELKDKLGESYAYMAEWDKAIPIYEALKEKHPENAEYWFRYGGVLAMKAQSSSRFTALTLIGKIKSSFIKAAELDDKHIDARWALVDVYLTLPGILGGSVTKAKKYANQLQTISSVDGYISIGYVYEYDDEPIKAKENYLKGLRGLDEVDSITRNQLRYQIGKITGDYGIKIDEGISHMKKFMDNYSVKDGVGKEWIYYRLARLYRHKNDKKMANEWVQKAIAINNEFDLALKERERIARMIML